MASTPRWLTRQEYARPQQPARLAAFAALLVGAIVE